MVAVPAPRYALPATPQPFGALFEHCIALWRASWSAGFGWSLLYGLANLLPALTLADLGRRVWRTGLDLLQQQTVPWLPGSSEDAARQLVDDVLAWLQAPSTWAVFALATALAIAAVSALMRRQARIARAEARSLGDDLRALPRIAGAWIVYALLMLLATLPLLGFVVGLFWWSAQLDDLALLSVLLLALLVGGLLLSVPLAWISVAAGYAPFLAADDARHGAFGAQRASMRLVRGRWVHAALVISVPMLLYVGVGSALSSAVMSACFAIAHAIGGWPMIIDGGWMLWAQLLTLAPMAAALPLATAGGVVGLHDLRLRAGIRD